MAPNLEFRYFRTTGIAQTIRMLVKYADLDYEDVSQEIEKLSGTEESEVFEISVATARYVARKVKLAGNDYWENLEIDAIVDTIGDLLMKIHMYIGEQNIGRKQVLKDKFFNEIAPFYFGRLDKVAADNKGHLALGKLTWVDFYFASLEQVFRSVVAEEVLDEYANLKTVIKNVSEIVSIQE